MMVRLEVAVWLGWDDEGCVDGEMGVWEDGRGIGGGLCAMGMVSILNMVFLSLVCSLVSRVEW